MKGWWWGLLLDGGSAFGVWLLARRRRGGWIVSIGNQVMWVLYSIVYAQWGFFPGIVGHAGLAVYGWMKWHDNSLELNNVESTPMEGTSTE